MPKQQITIEVDVPDGYEATGEFRSPALGEFFLQRNKVKRSSFEEYASDFVILRETWKWPESVTANWIAVDDDGRHVKLSDAEPQKQHQCWWCSCGRTSIFFPSHVTWTPPPPGTKHKNAQQQDRPA